MSHKAGQDKQREGFPFTARQRRRQIGNRLARKQARKKVGTKPKGRR